MPLTLGRATPRDAQPGRPTEVPRSQLATLASPLMLAFLWTYAAVMERALGPLASPSISLGRLGATVLVVLGINAVHELGHIVAGLVVGAPFTRFTLGLVTVVCERSERGPRISLELNRAWLKVAGCVERRVSPGPRARAALTVTALGGPIASIVVGLLLWDSPSPWREIGLISALVGLLNALPITSLGQMSDGMIVLRLWSSRPEDVAWRAHWSTAPAAVPRTPASTAV